MSTNFCEKHQSTDCDCCQGTQVLTPARVANRPGLSALQYRVGTHARFLESMKARLSNISIPSSDPENPNPTYPLAGLTTRLSSDPAIALLDGWATIADVLTFYQERIANEGYLGTASERRSILELARLIGYALRPGVSATVFLAVELDKDHEVVIQPHELRAQTVPGPGEMPQAFENNESLDARYAWNRLKPRQHQPQTLATIQKGGPSGFQQLYVKGISANLKQNDLMLLTAGFQQSLYHVQSITPDAPNDRTLVVFQEKSTAAEMVAAAPVYDTGKVIALANEYIQSKPASDRSKARTEMAQRVQAHLRNLVEQLQQPGLDATNAAGITSDALIKIAEEQAVAAGEQYAKLAPWLNEMHTTINAVHQSQSGAAQGFLAQPQAMSSATIPPKSNPFLKDPLSRALGDLARPGSIPPRNSQNLGRNLAQSFSSAADSGLQISATFDPRLRNNLPLTLANVKVMPDSDLHAYVFRVSTRPFGNNAPLEPVLDRSGRVVDHKEWAIGAEQIFAVTIDGIDNGAPAGLELTSNGKTSNANLSLPDVDSKTIVTLDSNQVVVLTTSETVAGEDNRLVFTFQADTLGDFLLVRDLHGSLQVVAKAGSESFDRTVKPGQTVSTTSNNQSLTIAYNGNGGLVVTFDSLLAADPKNVIDLESPFDQIIPGGWAVIQRADTDIEIIANVQKVQALSRADYGITGKSTRLTLDKDWLTGSDYLLTVMRNTAVYAQSEELTLAEAPLDSPVCDGQTDLIELDALYSGMQSGRWLILSGERSDISTSNGDNVASVRASELVMLAEVIQDVVTEGGEPYYSTLPAAKPGPATIGNPPPPVVSPPLAGDKPHTFIRLAKTLEYCYKRETVTIYGNVVKASHGETRKEILGNGDASQAFQTFTLKQSPLTYTSSPIPAGAESSLNIYVNDVRWSESGNLVGLSPTDHKFVTKTDDEGKTTVTFGNGISGARLPTAPTNVRSEYRNGIGKPGNVQAGQISLIAAKPLGVQSVINPLRASGGADRESRDTARKNAPRTVTALDRLVSVSDYADFSRTFAGIGKSVASKLSYQGREVVQVTIAGADDTPIDTGSDLYHNLLLALRNFGDPDLPVILQVRDLILLLISANIAILPDYQWEPVNQAVRAALLDSFSFDRRELGKDLALSEVISVIQAVPGVDYVDVDALGIIPEKTYDRVNGKAIARLLTPQEISALVQRQLARHDPGPVLGEKGGATNSGNRIGNLFNQVQPIQHLPLSQYGGLHGNALNPAALAYLSPDVADTLVLNQVK